MIRTIATALAVAVGLAGCAATYEPPTTKPGNFSASIDKPKGAIFAAAKRALVLDGYQILSSDEAAGVLSTAKRQVRLTPADADCGTDQVIGVSYLEDKRTITHLAVGVVISDRAVRIKTDIDGEYLKRHVSAGIAMKCVSKGRIEAALLSKIKDQLN